MNLFKIIRAIFCKHESEPFFTEHKAWVHTSRCRKCKTELGLPKWKWYNCPPPPYEGKVTTNEEWNNYIDNHIEELKMSVVSKRIELGLE